MEIKNDKKDLNLNKQKRNSSINNTDNINPILFKSPLKLKKNCIENNRYFQTEKEENEITSIIDEDNYISIFNEVTKSFDNIIFRNEKEYQKNKNDIINNQPIKTSLMNNSINEEKIDYNNLSLESYNILYQIYSNKKNILLLKNQLGNNLSQYYISSGLFLVSLEIIKTYHKIYAGDKDGEQNFFDWLINDNNDCQNVLEIGVGIRADPEEQILFYKQVFELIEKANNKKVIYKILEKRKENIFILCSKEEKLFLLLFFYEKIKKYYPSSNPLDLDNKSGLTPLHFSCYYLSREITNALLTLDCKVNPIDKNGNIPLHFAVKAGDLSITKKLLLYGGNKIQINNKNLSPIDYANKYSNNAMKNLFTNNPFYKVDNIKNQKHDDLFMLFFVGCFILKFFLYKKYDYFWKYYIIDIICFLYFLYFIFKKKDYYLNSKNKTSSKDINYEKLFIECNYDKNKIKRICPKCKLIKTSSMVHCLVCDKCVEDFDHHCAWINKCINNKVYIHFIFFLICILVDFVMNFISFIFIIIRMTKEKRDKNIFEGYYIKKIFVCIYLFFFAFGIILICRIFSEKIKGKILSKKYSEENLLNKNSLENKLLEEKIKKSNEFVNESDIKNSDSIIKIKEENKEEEIDIKNLYKD